MSIQPILTTIIQSAFDNTLQQLADLEKILQVLEVDTEWYHQNETIQRWKALGKKKIMAVDPDQKYACPQCQGEMWTLVHGNKEFGFTCTRCHYDLLIPSFEMWALIAQYFDLEVFVK